jgi:ABC-type spermidine/putrescine transport system permease subunit I
VASVSLDGSLRRRRRFLARRMRRGRDPMYSPALMVVLLAPLSGLLIFLVALPFARAIHNSLVSGDRFAEPYVALLHDPVFWPVLVRTLVAAGLVSLISLLIAYPVAEFIHRSTPQLRPVLLAIVVVPLWSSAVARVYGWWGFFVRDGVLDRFAHLFGAGPLRLLFTKWAVFVGMVHLSLPVILLVAYAAVRNYDERLTMASLSLGASRLKTLVAVKLPVLAPPLLAGTAGVFILALGFFETPALLGGPDSQLISNLIYEQITGRFDFARAQAMSVVLLLATLACLGIVGAMGQAIRRTQA